jgi:hypothetical protein
MADRVRVTPGSRSNFHLIVGRLRIDNFDPTAELPKIPRPGIHHRTPCEPIYVTEVVVEGPADCCLACTALVGATQFLFESQGANKNSARLGCLKMKDLNLQLTGETPCNFHLEKLFGERQ